MTDVKRMITIPVLMTLIVIRTMAVTVSFDRLDSLIAAQPRIIADKEARLSSMKAGLATQSTVIDRYCALEELYEEYAAYQYDSAYSCVSECIRLAQLMNDGYRLNESRLNLSHILSTACLMDKTRQVLLQIDSLQLAPEQLIRYHRTWIDLYVYQDEYMQGTQYAAEYNRQLVNLRKRVIGIDTDHRDVNYLLTLAECYADQQEQPKAIKHLLQLMEKYRSGERLYSIITSMIAYYYSQMGDKEQQMRYLIMSAESDLEGCIRENTSLRTIADRLFDEGDIDRAYRYMRVAVDDANFYGTRLRNIQSSRIVPKILDAYQTKQEQSHRNMIWLLGVISVIALLLVVGVVAIYQLLKRYRRLNEQKRAINEQLREVNHQLEDTVEQLHETNGLLREREKLKEEYIARFLALSSRFIDRGEEQRKALYRLYRDRKTDDLAHELKSTHHGIENAQLFYENFDNAFLNIFPNFVDEVNKLLNEDGKIEVKQGKRLTTESRVLALIRISITDNQTIADILRASISTIYTYRSKLKARAINRENFETLVKSID